MGEQDYEEYVEQYIEDIITNDEKFKAWIIKHYDSIADTIAWLDEVYEIMEDEAFEAYHEDYDDLKYIQAKDDMLMKEE